MIVKQSNKGWLIIYQAAHGLLAGKIANELSLHLRPEYWLETLTAIIEHDDHQLRFDEKSYLNKIGLPIDFVLEDTPDEKVVERANRVYEKVRKKSKYTALLVSIHLQFLYGDMENNAMKEFLNWLKTDQQKIRKLYGLKKKDSNQVYEILRFCDDCSLIFCKNLVPEFGRSLEINTSILGKTYLISKNESDQINIEPWPFEKNKFQLSIEQHLVKTANFKDNNAFKKALENAQTEFVKWEFYKN